MGDVMKIMTLNTNSFRGEKHSQIITWIVEKILRERPDMIAMQKVRQTFRVQKIPEEMRKGLYLESEGLDIRADNDAACIAHRLHGAGVQCSWIWRPANAGSGDCSEGNAILSLGGKIRSIDQFPISRISDFRNRNTHAALGVQVEGMDDWFYSLCMNPFNVAGDGFSEQLKRLNCCIAGKRLCAAVWLAGAVSAADSLPVQSYQYGIPGGWKDCCDIAGNKGKACTPYQRMQRYTSRYDLYSNYLWCSQMRNVVSFHTVRKRPENAEGADYTGILVEVKE